MHTSLIISFIVSVVLMVTSMTARAAEAIPQAYKQCAACHGEQGQGNQALSSPAIAGLSESYIIRQLNYFASGKRGSHEKDLFGQQMVAVSKTLDFNKDVPDIARFLSSLDLPKIEEQVAGDLKNGTRYYHAKCGACHGGQGQGNESFKAPKLAGQHHAYLQRQMDNFIKGVRGAHAKDKYGRQMAMMAKTVSEKELSDILFYISQQRVD